MHASRVHLAGMIQTCTINVPREFGNQLQGILWHT